MLSTIIAAFAMTVIGLAVHEAVKGINIKPFNCSLCLVFWLSLISSFGIYQDNETRLIYIGFAVLFRQILWHKWRTLF